MTNSEFYFSKPIVAMIHLLALPGTPSWAGNRQAIIDHALRDAEKFISMGANALLIENMHDVPYLKGHVGPEITAFMAVVADRISQNNEVPIGLQILAGANRESMAAAFAGGVNFIRAEGFVYGHIADEGWIESSAGELLRFRKAIGAESVKIFADIKKKHSSHSVTADVTIEETAKAADFFKADGLVVTGNTTGVSADILEVQEVKDAIKIPVWVGSGINQNNLKYFWHASDGFIVGSAFKHHGLWSNDVDWEKVKLFFEETAKLRPQ